MCIMAPTDIYVQNLILDFIREKNVESVCDYGCGKGALLAALDREFPGRLSLTGVDCFSTFPEPQRPEAGAGITLVDRETDQFEDLLEQGRFDLVVSTFALHHYRYPVRELGNMAALLAPGGAMIIADLAFDNLNSAQIVKNICSYVWENFAAFQGKYHRHHYTLEEALDILSAVDVEVTEAFKKRITLSDADLEEEARSQLAHFDRSVTALPGFESRIMKDYFRFLMPYLRNMVEEHKIDYSSILVIVARKL
jgi:SAM-dependent methyltransferase